ncbi:MAG: hypothetical protein WBD47_16280 [Phormidesmis sp.]
MSQEILLYTTNVQAAAREIAESGGRITQQFTDAVVVASFPDEIEAARLQNASTQRPDSLDTVSQLAADAWNNSQARSRGMESPRPEEGLSWDTPGYTPPQYIHTDPDHTDDPESSQSPTAFEERPEASTGTPTSRYMIGSIAVGVVIVSGTRSDLAFSQAEQQKVIQEVQEGLNFLANAEPRANVSFVYDIRLVTVSATPGSTNSYESAEAPWRNAALQQMGYSANRSGSVDYVKDLHHRQNTDWAYVSYFTKYPLHHFAYAVSEKVCMHYGNDGWGSDAINRVFAHETCHIFGAADEYGSCSCGSLHGHLSVPNNNCVNCSETPVPCLMEANVLEICQWSRAQIGWDNRLFPRSTSENLYQLHKNGLIWQYTGTACSGDRCPGWQKLDSNPATAAIATSGGNLYQLHENGFIWQYTGTSGSDDHPPRWQKLDNNPETTAIAADGDRLYQLHKTGAIWKYTGTPCAGARCPGWQKLDNNPATTAIAASGGNLYQLHSTGAIWKYTGTPCSDNRCPGWQQLDNNPATSAIAADGNSLYQLHSTGAIWKYTGTPCADNRCPGWQKLDNNSATSAIAAGGGKLYQLHSTGAIWQYTETPCAGDRCPGWQQLDNNPATGAITVEGQHLYQLHKSGLIWQYTGTPCADDHCPGWQQLDNNSATVKISSSGASLP